MSEGPLKRIENPATERERKINGIIALVREINESRERIPFPGIHPEAYAKLKKGEQEDPGYVTPIDELLARFQNEGMRVVMGRLPAGGNVFIVPSQSADVENDSILPRQLQIDGATDARLKELVARIHDLTTR